jgi:hypothetical protein
MNRGQAIQDVGARTRETANQEMAGAQQALASQANAAQAAAPLQQAARAAGARADELSGLLDQYESTQAGRRARAGDPAEGEASRWMARALDQLDRDAALSAAQASTATEPSGDAVPEVGRAMAAQASAMAQARRRQGAQATSGRQGAPVHVRPEDSRLEVASSRSRGVRDWGQLPERMARELRSARRERVPEEYRTMVDAYFETVAEMSRPDAGTAP